MNSAVCCHSLDVNTESGGGRGIRTPERVTPLTVFKCESAVTLGPRTSPNMLSYLQLAVRCCRDLPIRARPIWRVGVARE